VPPERGIGAHAQGVNQLPVFLCTRIRTPAPDPSTEGASHEHPVRAPPQIWVTHRNAAPYTTPDTTDTEARTPAHGSWRTASPAAVLADGIACGACFGDPCRWTLNTTDTEGRTPAGGSWRTASPAAPALFAVRGLPLTPNITDTEGRTPVGGAGHW